jgi:hypothetical protein
MSLEAGNWTNIQDSNKNTTDAIVTAIAGLAAVRLAHAAGRRRDPAERIGHRRPARRQRAGRLANFRSNLLSS